MAAQFRLTEMTSTSPLQTCRAASAV